MTEFQLYTRHNLEALVWPDTPDGRYARLLLPALLQHGTLRYIDNIDAEVQRSCAGMSRLFRWYWPIP